MSLDERKEEKMMKRSIIIFPKFRNLEKIEEIRKKYDPLYNCIKPHITVVFPFESNIKTEELEKHVKQALKGIKPFKIRLKGITGTTDNYLFLNIKEGNDKIIEIHDKLYTGILEKFLYRKITYIPHITVGKVEDVEEFEIVLEETEKIQDTFETVVEEICVELIDENDKSNIEFTVKL
ncbi:2'-5' RNA ligase family protein [Caloranaerobacter ferrireducens]|uniref:2'-5' RNA ligase family protein n=1 Tax=Caloranaerobacter ferrireducens TaxID=1323370 RepID=UPI001FA6CD12|nr:2'-5' RNA ligase family protein [Caloranaerobacter ferrireducens]